ncbi:hypothetical protein CUMW_181120 [Citrus unshiu]|nr:hypothetical protein CUMW_181120 [Citrus unshiu]
MSSTKSIPFQYLIAALIAILKHFYGTEAINAFAEGAAGAGQCKCTENAFGVRGFWMSLEMKILKRLGESSISKESDEEIECRKKC